MADIGIAKRLAGCAKREWPRIPQLISWGARFPVASEVSPVLSLGADLGANSASADVAGSGSLNASAELARVMTRRMGIKFAQRAEAA